MMLLEVLVCIKKRQVQKPLFLVMTVRKNES